MQQNYIYMLCIPNDISYAMQGKVEQKPPLHTIEQQNRAKKYTRHRKCMAVVDKRKTKDPQRKRSKELFKSLPRLQKIFEWNTFTNVTIPEAIQPTWRPPFSTVFTFFLMNSH